MDGRTLHVLVSVAQAGHGTFAMGAVCRDAWASSDLWAALLRAPATPAELVPVQLPTRYAEAPLEQTRPNRTRRARRERPAETSAAAVRPGGWRYRPPVVLWSRDDEDDEEDTDLSDSDEEEDDVEGEAVEEEGAADEEKEAEGQDETRVNVNDNSDPTVINKWAPEGSRWLLAAAACGHSDRCAWLASLAPPPAALDGALVLAAAGGHTVSVEALVRCGADVDARRAQLPANLSGSTRLGRDHLGWVGFYHGQRGLRSAVSEPNWPWSNGRDGWAIVGDSREGAANAAYGGAAAERGLAQELAAVPAARCSPLLRALAAGHSDTALRLLALGARTAVPVEDDRSGSGGISTPDNDVLAFGRPFQLRNSANRGDERSSLHIAAWRGDVRVIEVLLNAGADILAQSHMPPSELFGRQLQSGSALDVAVLSGRPEAVRLLLRRGSRLRLPEAGPRGSVTECTLHMAVELAAKCSQRANPLRKLPHHLNPSNHCPPTQEEVVRRLGILCVVLAHIVAVDPEPAGSGANSSAATAAAADEIARRTGLYQAFKHFSLSEPVELVDGALLDAAVQLSARGSSALLLTRALCFAARRGHLDAIDVLIAVGADVEQTDAEDEWYNKGRPLELAAKGGHHAALQLLLARGAAPTTKALDVAAEQQRTAAFRAVLGALLGRLRSGPAFRTSDDTTAGGRKRFVFDGFRSGSTDGSAMDFVKSLLGIVLRVGDPRVVDAVLDAIVDGVQNRVLPAPAAGSAVCVAARAGRMDVLAALLDADVSPQSMADFAISPVAITIDVAWTLEPSPRQPPADLPHVIGVALDWAVASRCTDAIQLLLARGALPSDMALYHCCGALAPDCELGLERVLVQAALTGDYSAAPEWLQRPCFATILAHAATIPHGEHLASVIFDCVYAHLTAPSSASSRLDAVGGHALLDAAAAAGRLDIIGALLDAGLTVSQPTAGRDSDSYSDRDNGHSRMRRATPSGLPRYHCLPHLTSYATPLTAAVHANRTDAVTLLVKRGACAWDAEALSAAVKGHPGPLCVLLDATLTAAAGAEGIASAQEMATRLQLPWLLKLTIHSQSYCDMGSQQLHAAGQECLHLLLNAVLRVLAMPRARAACFDSPGVLRAAAAAGRTDAITALLAAGADVHDRDPPPTDTRHYYRGIGTALLAAVEYGHVEAARLLLSAGATPWAEPLHRPEGDIGDDGNADRHHRPGDDMVEDSPLVAAVRAAAVFSLLVDAVVMAPGSGHIPSNALQQLTLLLDWMMGLWKAQKQSATDADADAAGSAASGDSEGTRAVQRREEEALAALDGDLLRLVAHLASASVGLGPQPLTLTLCAAAEAGRASVVAAAIDAGGDPNASWSRWSFRPEDQDPAVEIAANAGHHDVVRLLVAHGATLWVPGRTEHCCWLLESALGRKDLAMVAALLDRPWPLPPSPQLAGASDAASCSTAAAPAAVAFTRPSLDEALRCASRADAGAEMIDALMSIYGSSSNGSSDGTGSTPAPFSPDAALRDACLHGNVTAVLALLTRGADASSPVPASKEGYQNRGRMTEGATPLLLAVRGFMCLGLGLTDDKKSLQAYIDIIRALMAHGADPRAKDVHGVHACREARRAWRHVSARAVDAANINLMGLEADMQAGYKDGDAGDPIYDDRTYEEVLEWAHREIEELLRAPKRGRRQALTPSLSGERG